MKVAKVFYTFSEEDTIASQLVVTSGDPRHHLSTDEVISSAETRLCGKISEAREDLKQSIASIESKIDLLLAK